jgi:hypothetical protein
MDRSAYDRRHDNPIFIAAPVRRSGTTLLQRLCCGSGEALVFGEMAADDLFQLGQVMQYKQQMIAFGSGRRDQMLEEVLAGKVNQWIPDLLPFARDYAAIQDRVMDGLCEGYSVAAGKGRRWGVKLPEWYPTNLAFWQNRLPASKTIYIVREIEACVTSARRIGIIKAPEDEAFFRNNHQQFEAMARQMLKPAQTYFLDYAALCDERAEGELVRLADFLNLTALPAEVLRHRIGDY